MSSLFNYAVKQSQILKRDLEAFEAAPEDAPPSTQGQLSVALTAFQKAIDNYAAAIQHEPSDDKKKQGHDRLDKFRTEIAEAREKYKVLKAKREASSAAANRQELFARRQPAAAASENPFAQPQADVSREEGLLREDDVLSRAGAQLDEFIERGRHALGDLTDQNDLLRGTQRTLHKAASTLGVSAETVRKVERRLKEDKIVFYGGIATLVVCFYLTVRWLG